MPVRLPDDVVRLVEADSGIDHVELARKLDLVAAELAKLHEHLLAPLGVTARPTTLGQAIASYRVARQGWEQQLHCQIPRAAEQAVTPALS